VGFQVKSHRTGLNRIKLASTNNFDCGFDEKPQEALITVFTPLKGVALIAFNYAYKSIPLKGTRGSDPYNVAYRYTYRAHLNSHALTYRSIRHPVATIGRPQSLGPVK
jgi:hypothetical protein